MTKEEAMRNYALSLVGCGYIFGATGWICSEARRKQQAKQYPDYADVIMGTGAKWDGKVCFDCAQLTRRMLELIGLKPPSGALSQYKRASLYEQAGPIGELPAGRLAQLFRVKADDSVPHTGVALGDGTAVDARGHAEGVVRMPVSKYPWTHYKLIAGAGEEYGEATPSLPEQPKKSESKDEPEVFQLGDRTIRKGDRGDDVRELQEALIGLRYDLGRYGEHGNGVDGSYGDATILAVRALQGAAGIAADGIFGPQTLAALRAQQEGNPVGNEPETVAIVLKAVRMRRSMDTSSMANYIRLLGVGDQPRIRGPVIERDGAKWIYLEAEDGKDSGHVVVQDSKGKYLQLPGEVDLPEMPEKPEKLYRATITGLNAAQVDQLAKLWPQTLFQEVS